LDDKSQRCFAAHLQSPLDIGLRGNLFEKVYSGTRWVNPVDSRTGAVFLRATSWMVQRGCTCTYAYGGVDVLPEVFPPWMHELMELCMPLCGLREDAWPNSCNLNLYESGKAGVGWHADDEELFQGTYDEADVQIISLSLGATRTFELRTKATDAKGEREVFSVALADGDLCTMEGLTQHFYQHAVPEETATGPRINLTWRHIRRHQPGCALACVSKEPLLRCNN